MQSLYLKVMLGRRVPLILSILRVGDSQSWLSLGRPSDIVSIFKS
jgi:hypothetical protein